MFLRPDDVYMESLIYSHSRRTTNCPKPPPCPIRTLGHNPYTGKLNATYPEMMVLDEVPGQPVSSDEQVPLSRPLTWQNWGYCLAHIIIGPILSSQCLLGIQILKGLNTQKQKLSNYVKITVQPPWQPLHTNTLAL